MGKSKAPAPPDPQETAQAQTGTNIGTAIANNAMTMVDQQTPDGSLTYTQNGTYTYTDPYTGQSYDIPRYLATTQLSDTGQAIQDQNNAAKLGLAEIGNNQTQFLKDYLSQPFQADTGAIEDRLSELGRARLDPMFEQRRSALDSKLANQGIVPGSEAYNRAMTQMGQQENDAYNQLFLTGRGQAFGELQAQRNQPINEITALLSGSQVSQPGVSMTQPQGAATTDVAGLINTNYQQKYNNWQAQNAQTQSLLGGLFGLASGGLAGGYF